MTNGKKAKLTRLEIEKNLKKNLGLATADAKFLVARFFSTIADTLHENTDVKIQGFGTFKQITTAYGKQKIKFTASQKIMPKHDTK
jgi:nucleoid DNA-binding protein